MSKKNPNTAKKEEKKFSRTALLKSEHFAGYQKDFLAAVLCKPEYTIAEAEKAVKKFFRKD